MPALDRSHWQRRQNSTLKHRSWCDDAHVDAAHEMALLRALDKVWPKDAFGRVMDVGCGDGLLSSMISDRYRCIVLGVDSMRWMPWRGGLLMGFVLGDAAEIDEIARRGSLRFDLVTMINSLPFMSDWRAAIRAAAEVAPALLVFGDFANPPRQYAGRTTYMQSISSRDLILEAMQHNLLPAMGVTATVLHREPFERTPNWMHRWMVRPVALSESVLSSMTSPYSSRARHTAWLFRRDRA